MNRLSQQHFLALDGLRGIAILLVSLYRFTLGPGTPFEDRYWKGVFEFGQRGVDLFFVLSGFLITGILFDTKSDRHYFRNFYIRRSLRIFPLYYGVLFLAFVLAPMLGPKFAQLTERYQDQQLWLWLYGTNIYLSWMNDWTVLGAFNHFWSLAVEEQFYLVWPMIVLWCNWKWLVRLCFAFIGIAFITRFLAHTVWDLPVAAEALTPFRMDGFAVGGLIALWLRGPTPLETKRIRWLEYGLAIVVMLIAFGLQGRSLKSTTYTLYALFFGVVLIWAISAQTGTREYRFWTWAPLRFLGKYSYAMYVFQALMIPAFQSFFSQPGLISTTGSPFLGRLIYFFGMFTGSIVLAMLSWHLWEKHFLKLKVYFQAKEPDSVATKMSARNEKPE